MRAFDRPRTSRPCKPGDSEALMIEAAVASLIYQAFHIWTAHLCLDPPYSGRVVEMVFLEWALLLNLLSLWSLLAIFPRSQPPHWVNRVVLWWQLAAVEPAPAHGGCEIGNNSWVHVH